VITKLLYLPGRLWFDWPQQGALYSPDGSRIQFDGGTIWVRAPELPPPHPPRYRK
jgi:hypothetical protein